MPLVTEKGQLIEDPDRKNLIAKRLEESQDEMGVVTPVDSYFARHATPDQSELDEVRHNWKRPEVYDAFSRGIGVVAGKLREIMDGQDDGKPTSKLEAGMLANAHNGVLSPEDSRKLNSYRPRE